MRKVGSVLMILTGIALILEVSGYLLIVSGLVIMINASPFTAGVVLWFIVKVILAVIVLWIGVFPFIIGGICGLIPKNKFEYKSKPKLGIDT